MRANKNVIVRRIHELAEQNPELMAFFENKKIMPGIKVKVTEVLSLNQTITLKVEKQTVVLGFASARFVYVEVFI